MQILEKDVDNYANIFAQKLSVANFYNFQQNLLTWLSKFKITFCIFLSDKHPVVNWNKTPCWVLNAKFVINVHEPVLCIASLYPPSGGALWSGNQLTYWLRRGATSSSVLCHSPNGHLEICCSVCQGSSRTFFQNIHAIIQWKLLRDWLSFWIQNKAEPEQGVELC